MNRRLLLALYDRSGLGAYLPVDYNGHELEVAEHMEKFAELIVLECSRIADDWVNNEDNGKNYPSDKIKQHFEVE